MLPDLFFAELPVPRPGNGPERQQGVFWAAGRREAPPALQAGQQEQRHPDLPVKQWGTGTRLAVAQPGRETKAVFTGLVSHALDGGESRV